jgi:DHA1 family tetracycline resistance protein-like MFS transporter
MSDNVPAAERVKWHGRMSAALGFGMLGGAAIGGLAADVDIRLPFKFAASGYLCALGFVAYAVSGVSQPAAGGRSLRGAFGGVLQTFLRPFRTAQSPSRFIVVFALVTFSEMLVQSTWMLYTVWRFNWTALDNAKAFVLMGCMALIVQSMLLSRLVDRLGQSRLLVLAIVSGCLAYLTAGIAHQAWMLGLAVLLGMLNAVLGPLLRAIISEGVASDRQGEAMGLLHAIGGFGLVGMPLLGAVVMGLPTLLPSQPWTGGAVFLLASSMQIAALVLVWGAIKAPAALIHGTAADLKVIK